MEEPQLKDILTPYLEAIEEEIEASIPSPAPGLERFYGMMGYHLGWLDSGFCPEKSDAGKHIRPVLCLLGAEAACGGMEVALPAACALELLHNFTLIHDDIEDNSDQRRHRDTVWRLWGVPQAINTGDGMFSVAHLTLLSLAGRGVPAEKIVEIIQTFEQTVLEICEGQYLDISFENRAETSTVEYLSMIERKTAVLLAASLKLGALTAPDPDGIANSLYEAGRLFGLAFQIRDDEIGVWGDPEVTGKPLAADIVQKKKGLPVVYAFEQSEPADRKRLEAIYQKIALAQNDVDEVLAILDKIDAQGYCRATGRDFYEQGLAALPKVTERVSEEAMIKIRVLAAALAERDY